MPIDADVVVIGGGIAGMTAALSAARNGADVRLLTKAESTLAQASGLIDVLGYTPGGDGPLVDPFDHVEALPEGHPYERVGTAGIRDGLALFDDLVGDRYEGGHTDRNALVPTHGGTVKPTARYPAATSDGLTSDERDALLVGFEGSTAFDAPFAADHLEAVGVPFDVRGATVRFPGDVRADAMATRYARALDQNETTADGRGTIPGLADAVATHHGGEPRVGFPAVLGEERPAAVRQGLADHLGADVFEVPMGAPSLPGRRLAADFDDALADAGVAVTAGNPVVDATVADGRIEAVVLDRNRQRVPVQAAEFVLATGGLVGTGLASDRTTVREPIFDCHVPQPPDRADWFDDDPFGEHAFARFGVRVDRAVRPLDAAGDPEFANLRAAGSVLGGYDFAAEKSGAGVSLATGAVAGRAAARYS